MNEFQLNRKSNSFIHDMKQSFHTASKPFSESDQRPRGNFSAIQIREK